jgi:hypothetical protein
MLIPFNELNQKQTITTFLHRVDQSRVKKWVENKTATLIKQSGGKKFLI